MLRRPGPPPPLLQAPALLGIPGLAHGLTTRAGGTSHAPYATLNLGLGTDDDVSAVQENRRRVAQTLGFARLETPYQVHGRAVVDARDLSGAQRPRADAVVTNEPGRLVGVLGADCPGILLVDPVQRALGVVHAGWRGFAAGVLSSCLEALGTRYGSQEADLRVFLGAAISGPHYEVDAPVLDAVARQLPADWRDPSRGILQTSHPGHGHLDLRAAIHLQLTTLGVAPERIEAVSSCTYADHRRFFSHRRDGATSGRHALVAGWLA